MPESGERRRGQRRQKRVPRPFREDRRSGFDRRASHPGGPVTRALRWLRDSRRGVADILIGINLLNVVDLLLTFMLLGNGIVEANPVMRILIGNDPLGALFVKLAIVALVTLGMWRQRRYKVILGLAVLTFAGFVMLAGWEIWLLLTR
jgi:hypothetical protein